MNSAFRAVSKIAQVRQGCWKPQKILTSVFSYTHLFGKGVSSILTERLLCFLLIYKPASHKSINGTHFHEQSGHSNTASSLSLPHTGAFCQSHTQWCYLSNLVMPNVLDAIVKGKFEQPLHSSLDFLVSGAIVSQGLHTTDINI